MKKMKSILALLLCLAMMLGCLTGCGQKQEEAAPEAAPEATPEAAPGGESTEPVKLTIGLQQNINVEDYETNDFTLWLEETANVDLEFQYFSADKEEAMTQLNLMISGGERLPDILWGLEGMDKATLNEFGEDGYFIDVKPYFDEHAEYFWEGYNMLSANDQNMIFALGTNPTDGAMYAFPAYQDSYGDSPLAMTFINTKWLEAVGAETPETVDELYEVLKKFATEDPNGNGKADEIPAAGAAAMWRSYLDQYIINAYVYCNDESVLNATDGNVWVPYTTDEYRQAMIYLNKLVSEGLLSPLTFTISEWAEQVALFTPTDGTAIVGVNSGHPILTTEQDNPVMLEYTGLAPLAAATELGGYANFCASTYMYYTAITADCENPVAAFKLLDLMSSPEAAKRMRYGVKDRDWKEAPEGATDGFGITATVEVLPDAQHEWGQQGNASWQYNYAIIAPGVMNLEFKDDGSWNASREKLCYSGRNAYDARPVPETVIYDLVYTSEENEVVSEYKTLIVDYVKEARGLFATGVMDPSNDADWQSYLDNLEALKLSDYLDVSQAAYTRMFG